MRRFDKVAQCFPLDQWKVSACQRAGQTFQLASQMSESLVLSANVIRDWSFWENRTVLHALAHGFWRETLGIVCCRMRRWNFRRRFKYCFRSVSRMTNVVVLLSICDSPHPLLISFMQWDGQNQHHYVHGWKHQKVFCWWLKAPEIYSTVNTSYLSSNSGGNFLLCLNLNI